MLALRGALTTEDIRRRRTELAALAFLVIAGLLYYGQYYRHGFKVGDEGSVVLLTELLLNGKRPYVDVELGYGPLWFYPLVLLFKLTGVSLILASSLTVLASATTSLLV